MIYIKNELDEWVGGVPTKSGQKYKEVFDSGLVVESFYYKEVETVKYEIENKVVTVAGVISPDFGGVYFASKNDSINLSMKLVGGDSINLTSPPYPPFLMLPILKLSASGSVINEVYLRTVIENGMITISGQFTESGNWQLTQERVNASLAEIHVKWQVTNPTITFRVA